MQVMQTNDFRQLVEGRGLKLSGLADRLGVHRSTVTRWAQREVPVERLVEIERATGIPRQELRPDIFGAAE